jgi:hypothetical protein
MSLFLLIDHKAEILINFIKILNIKDRIGLYDCVRRSDVQRKRFEKRRGKS